MFNNIGKKIKTLAVVICIVGMVLSVLVGLVAAAFMPISGIIIMLFGCLSSWIGAFSMYGNGELIDKTCEIAAIIRKTSYSKIETVDDKINKIRNLRQQGLISDNEYRSMIAEIQNGNNYNGFNSGMRL